MKMKRTLSFIAMLPFLIGCAKKIPYVGTYVFQMGKSKGTHMGVSLELKKDFYDENDETKGRKFDLNIDMSTSDNPDDFMNIIKDMGPLSGYYSVDKENKVYNEKRLHIGINVLGEYEIPEEITDLIFVANINSTLANFYLPVSLNDLVFQLYWYGYDLNFSELIDPESEGGDPFISPDGEHDVGTHPTQADIDKINEHYENDHGQKYRDFHVLKLGLTKK